MNEAYQIHSIGMVVFLFLLSGIPWTIYSLLHPHTFLKKTMLIIVICIMIGFIAIKVIPQDIKFNYVYPFLGGFFLPEFFSSLMKKISTKLQENAELEEKENIKEEDTSYYKEKNKKGVVRNNKEVYKEEMEIHENSVNEDSTDKDFIEIPDETIEKRKRIKRKTVRKRELNIDE